MNKYRMTRFSNKNIKRFFAFGCSFTRYAWTTWPEIIAEDLGVDEYYNLGLSGAGNEFIFNRLMQVDRLAKLDANDLVMICWTSVNREDRYVNGDWMRAGNIYSQKLYPPEFVKSYYPNPEEAILHDFAYIRASRVLLEHRQSASHMLQMSNIAERLDDWSDECIDPSNDLHNMLDEELPHIKPSFLEILWDNKMPNRKIDSHPSPLEHFMYLDRVFDHEWKQSTIDKINELEREYQELFKPLKLMEELERVSFSHLRPYRSMKGIR